MAQGLCGETWLDEEGAGQQEQIDSPIPLVTYLGDLIPQHLIHSNQELYPHLK